MDGVCRENLILKHCRKKIGVFGGEMTKHNSDDVNVAKNNVGGSDGIIGLKIPNPKELISRERAKCNFEIEAMVFKFAYYEFRSFI